MTNILNKKLKISFGASNFVSSKPSNGIYLRLLLTALSKKGNWGALFRRFVNLSIESRRTLRLQAATLSVPERDLKPLNPFSNSHDISHMPANPCFRQLIQSPPNQPFLTNFAIKRINQRSVILLKNDKEIFNKKEHVLPSLRSVYSLFHPILVSIELKSKRRGGRVFLVPVPVKSDKRRHSIFIRWFKQSLNEQVGGSIEKLLVNELYKLSAREGKAMDRLVELDKTIKLNRVFLRKSQIKLI